MNSLALKLKTSALAAANPPPFLLGFSGVLLGCWPLTWNPETEMSRRFAIPVFAASALLVCWEFVSPFLRWGRGGASKAPPRGQAPQAPSRPYFAPWGANQVTFAIVVSTTDGDTFRAKAPPELELDPGKDVFWSSVRERSHKDGSIPIRIKHIDAPEKWQADGELAEEELGELLQPGDRVMLLTGGMTEDQFDRTIAEVRTMENICVAHAMIATGNAWWAGHMDKRYSDREDLREAQDAAKATREGMWHDIHNPPTPPWEARRAKRLEQLKRPKP